MGVQGRLYLIPVPIGEKDPLQYIPQYNLDIVGQLKHFIAEDAKNARRFLKLASYASIPDAEIYLLNEHTRTGDLSVLLQPLLQGEDVGLMSDAGCPGIADPGAEVVSIAHKKGITVIPLAGPSSVVLGIMASGFNGQNFAFVGYLPIEKTPRVKRIRELEQLATRQKQAQFFIETPYRNQQMAELLLETLSPATMVFIGKNIGEADQVLQSKAVAEWKRSGFPPLHKVPVVWGIY